MRLTRFAMIVLMLLICMCLGAFEFDYNVKSLGLHVAKINIKDDVVRGELSISAVSLLSNKMFPRINNKYLVNYQKDYLPTSYLRLIDQDNNQDSVFVSYKHNEKKAVMKQASQDGQSSYSLQDNTRDFFTFMIGLSYRKLTSNRYWIDGNGILWLAKIENTGAEILRTKQGKIKTEKFTLRFENTGEAKMPYIDMVTHNVLNQDTIVTLWISADNIVHKANVKKGLVNMVWELVNYHK
ncbi:MAG: DUF3108 domain-containing protein [Candidatus Cloacimonetes bacterium]|nr:DUF3108 domain-containing protein [Candidatus Cloacimonadota bacterium]